MALPLSPAPEEEGQPAEESIPAGYVQLPSDRYATEDASNGIAGHESMISDRQNSNSSSQDQSGQAIIRINGMDVHVYGDLAGLNLSNDSLASTTLKFPDSDEEEEDEQQGVQAEAAILQAFEADATLRSAPLSAEQCQAIKSAMQGISLGGFRPDWADRVPEEQWIRGLKEKLLPNNADSGSHSSA